MTNPSGVRPSSLALWGAIEGAVAQHASTADVWSAIKAAHQAEGGTGPRITVREVNILRGQAAAIRNASVALNAANPAHGFDGGQLTSTAPWARPQAERNALPMFQVRFQHTVQVNGQTQTEWRTVFHQGALPPTVGDLLANTEQRAQQMAAEYGTVHGSISGISVLAV